jgi:hypothetical protein
MRHKIRGSIAAALVGALALGVLDFRPAQAAPAKQQQIGAATLDLSARRRHHRYNRHHGGNRAALRAFGIIAGTIASIAAAEAARRDCRYYGDCYYGYGYRYGRRDITIATDITIGRGTAIIFTIVFDRPVV